MDAIDYIAHQMAIDAGGGIAPRWLCMREDLRAKWRGLAEQAVSNFIADEEQKRAERAGV